MATYSAPQHKPLISVVMPVYNTDKYVAEAIQSILHQTYSHWELILVDDGSTDNSRTIIEEYTRLDERIISIFSNHRGTSEAQNIGIARAKGMYIAHMDADDVSLPERLDSQWQWMQKTGLDVCGACVKCFGGREGIIWFPQDHCAIRAELLFRSALLPSAVMIRAQVLKDNLHTPGVTFHDYELWTRLAPYYRLGNMQRVLVQYRIHETQTSRLTAVQVQADLQKYRRRYFFKLFPEAEEDDFIAFQRLANEQPHQTLTELKLAASWLLRLGSSPDSFFQRRLAERWAQACCRSASLGMACFQIYQKAAPHFEKIEQRTIQKMLFLCFFRQGSQSYFYQTVKHIFSRKNSQNHAA